MMNPESMSRECQVRYSCLQNILRHVYIHVWLRVCVCARVLYIVSYVVSVYLLYCQILCYFKRCEYILLFMCTYYIHPRFPTQCAAFQNVFLLCVGPHNRICYVHLIYLHVIAKPHHFK